MNYTDDISGFLRCPECGCASARLSDQGRQCSYIYCRNCGWTPGTGRSPKAVLIQACLDLFRTARRRLLREGPPRSAAALLGLPSDPGEPFFEPLTFGIGRIPCASLPGLPDRFLRASGGSRSDLPGLIFPGGRPEGALNSFLVVDDEGKTSCWYIRNRRTSRFQFLMSPGDGPAVTAGSLSEGAAEVRRQIIMERRFTCPVLLDLPLPTPDSPVRTPSAVPASSSVSLPPIRWDSPPRAATGP